MRANASYTTRELVIDELYYSVEREKLLSALGRVNPAWEFRIGFTRLGTAGFCSEWPDFEIVSEYRPTLHDRVNRFAVYARLYEH